MGIGATISVDTYRMPEGAALSPEGRLAAISVDEISTFVELNKDVSNPVCPTYELADLLAQGRTRACGELPAAHPRRRHRRRGSRRKSFSDLGSGTMTTGATMARSAR
jgi:hypothetical protein